MRRRSGTAAPAPAGLASRDQVRPPSVVASRVPASPTAKQRDAVRHPTSYSVLVVPLPSAFEAAGAGAAGAGAAGAEVAQPATAARAASTASVILMNTCYHATRPGGLRRSTSLRLDDPRRPRRHRH